MKKDTDLDPLRGRDDFQRILKQMETKGAMRRMRPMGRMGDLSTVARRNMMKNG